MKIDNNNQDSESPEEIANNDPDYELPKERCRENVNRSVESLLFSPMKPVSNQYKVAYGKRKFDQVFNSNSELILSVLDLSVDELTGCASSKMTQKCCQKASELDQRKTKNSKQQRKSKASNNNTSTLINTTSCALFRDINSNGKEKET